MWWLCLSIILLLINFYYLHISLNVSLIILLLFFLILYFINLLNYLTLLVIRVFQSGYHLVHYASNCVDLR